MTPPRERKPRDPRFEGFIDYFVELVMDAAEAAAKRNKQPMPPQRIRDEIPHELKRDGEFMRVLDVGFSFAVRRLVREGLLKAERDPHQPNTHHQVYTIKWSLLDRLARAAGTQTGGP